MGLKDMLFSYYGRLFGEKAQRSFVDDFIVERKNQMLEEMKAMEDRLKRHITESKREIIRELKETKKPKVKLKKEKKNG